MQGWDETKMSKEKRDIPGTGGNATARNLKKVENLLISQKFKQNWN
jgi:hypothetical protein